MTEMKTLLSEPQTKSFDGFVRLGLKKAEGRLRVEKGVFKFPCPLIKKSWKKHLRRTSL